MVSVLHGTYIEKAGSEISYDMELRYYRTEQLLCSRYSDLKRYGIIIEKICIYENGEQSIERKQINDIFYREQDICEFLDMLMRNSVTPAGAEEIIKEYICSKLSVSR